MRDSLHVENEWNGARKVMNEVALAPVSFSAMKRFGAYRNSSATAQKNLRIRKNGDNALAANWRCCRNRVLNPVVEVQYTTGRLSLVRV